MSRMSGSTLPATSSCKPASISSTDGSSLFFADFVADLALQRDEALDGIVRQEQRLQHRVFVHLIGVAFDHVDRFGRAGHAQVKRAVGHLAISWIDLQLARHQADARARDRTVPGDIGYHQRGAGGDDAEHIDMVFLIMRKRYQDDLDIVSHILWEERAQRTVDDARRQNRALRWSAFAAEETARHATSGVHFLFIIHAKREEVQAGTRRAHGRRAEEHGIAHADGHSAAGLLRQAAGLDDDVFAGHGAAIFTNVQCHRILQVFSMRRAARRAQSVAKRRPPWRTQLDSFD